MAKPTTVKIRLNSSAGTGHFYVTKKNSRTMTDKMTVRKYDPVARKLYSAPYVVVSVEWAVRQCSRTPLVLVELTCQDNGTEAADTAAGDVVRC